jgi:ankyrin repeat protein
MNKGKKGGTMKKSIMVCMIMASSCYSAQKEKEIKESTTEPQGRRAVTSLHDVVQLWDAARQDDYATMRKLLTVQPSRINGTLSKSKMNLLMYAADAKKPALLRFLLEQPGLKLLATDIYGNTALHYAVGQEDKEAIKLLEEAGLSLYSPNKLGTTPLDYARSINVDFYNKLRKEEKEDSAQQAINAKAFGITLHAEFMRAAAQHEVNKMKQLLDDGVMINARTEKGETALMLQAADTSLAAKEAFDLLMSYPEIDIDAVDREGKSALHYAAEHNNVYAAKALLEFLHDVPPLARKCLGKGPGMLVSDYVFDLPGLTMRIDALDNNYQTPLFLALSHNAQAVAELLASIGADIDTELIYAAVRKNIPLMQKLIKLGANINAHMRDNGKTALIALAGEQGSEQEVSWLLEQPKIDKEAKDDMGFNALHWAVYVNNKDAIKALLAHKANIDAQNSTGRTPLMMAISLKNTAIAEYLLKHGAAVGAKDNEGK